MNISFPSLMALPRRQESQQDLIGSVVRGNNIAKTVDIDCALAYSSPSNNRVFSMFRRLRF